MRLAPSLLALVFLLLPPLASAQAVNPNECRHLERQIDHYADQYARAQALDSELWEERIGEHLAALDERYSERCADGSDPFAQELLALIKLAGSAALSYFTFGAF